MCYTEQNQRHTSLDLVEVYILNLWRRYINHLTIQVPIKATVQIVGNRYLKYIEPVQQYLHKKLYLCTTFTYLQTNLFVVKGVLERFQ